MAHKPYTMSTFLYLPQPKLPHPLSDQAPPSPFWLHLPSLWYVDLNRPGSFWRCPSTSRSWLKCRPLCKLSLTPLFGVAVSPAPHIPCPFSFFSFFRALSPSNTVYGWLVCLFIVCLLPRENENTSFRRGEVVFWVVLYCASLRIGLLWSATP